MLYICLLLKQKFLVVDDSSRICTVRVKAVSECNPKRRVNAIQSVTRESGCSAPDVVLSVAEHDPRRGHLYLTGEEYVLPEVRHLFWMIEVSSTSAIYYSNSENSQKRSSH